MSIPVSNKYFIYKPSWSQLTHIIHIIVMGTQYISFDEYTPTLPKWESKYKYYLYYSAYRKMVRNSQPWTLKFLELLKNAPQMGILTSVVLGDSRYDFEMHRKKAGDPLYMLDDDLKDRDKELWTYWKRECQGNQDKLVAHALKVKVKPLIYPWLTDLSHDLWKLKEISIRQCRKYPDLELLVDDCIDIYIKKTLNLPPHDKEKIFKTIKTHGSRSESSGTYPDVDLDLHDYIIFPSESDIISLRNRNDISLYDKVRMSNRAISKFDNDKVIDIILK